jgi:trk system potassium uptake protein TrkH
MFLQWRMIAKVLGVITVIFGLTLLIPLIIALLHQDGEALHFFASSVFIVALGLLLWLPNYRQQAPLQRRDGFLIVSLLWCLLSGLASLPLLWVDSLSLSFWQRLFEATSGLTTTGATVIVGLEYLPKSILWYRQQLQWLGGMGIVVLAVAILPILRIGGMQLIRAEMSKTLKDVHLTPRISEAAQSLWFIYVGLTLACALAYWLAGMNWFDAITHAFSTVSTAGFSTYDASLGHFNNHWIYAIASFFMLLGALNFTLHFQFVRQRHFSVYTQNSETVGYLLLLIILIVLISLAILPHFDYHFGKALAHGSLQTISFLTTSGFSTDNYWLWPTFVPVLLIFLSFIGGCSGSTAGGIKFVRVLFLVKQGLNEMRLLVHPNARNAIKLNQQIIDTQALGAVWGFFAAYILIFLIFMLLLMALGLDQVTAFSAVAATLNNLGPGLGEVAGNFQLLNDWHIGILSLAMIMGRLELFTLLILFSPYFWKA